MAKRTKAVPITIDCDADKCHRYCMYYDYSGRDSLYSNRIECTLYVTSCYDGKRCKQCLRDFGEEPESENII